MRVLPTPARIVSYLKGDWHGYGHTPIGGLAVFALLGILVFVVGTGLFANEDIAFQGPWFHLVSKSQSDSISSWHSKHSLFSSCCLCYTLRLSAFTSTFAIDCQKAEALDAGFDYCLTRPIDEDQLMALINLCWEKAEQIDFADDSTGSPRMESTIYRSSLTCQKIESALPQIR